MRSEYLDMRDKDMSNIRDNWMTPPELFKELDLEYGGFFWDACCTKENCLVKGQVVPDNYDFLTITRDELFKSITPVGATIFMNPPFSNKLPFLKKALKLASDFKVVILLPDNVMSASYMSIFDSYEHEHNNTLRLLNPRVEIRYIKKRVHFIPPNGIKASSPSFGCMLLVLN